MVKNKIKIILVLLFSLCFVFSMTFMGCIKVYPEGKKGEEAEMGQEEEFIAEEPLEEEPPPEEHFDEEPPPEEEPPQQEPQKIPEQEVKERCFHKAQNEIEDHSIYKNVVFDTEYDDNFVAKVKGQEYTYKCGIEFSAFDTNVNKDGHFVWEFVVRYDPNSDSCVVEGGNMQSEVHF